MIFRHNRWQLSLNPVDALLLQIRTLPLLNLIIVGHVEQGPFGTPGIAPRW